MPSPPIDDERQPLLPQDEDHLDEVEPSPALKIWKWFIEGAAALKEFLFGDPILICTFCLQFCTYFSKHMVEVPMIKLFEQAICDRYYAAHGELSNASAGPINERLCKIPAIQNELAGLVGWKFTFDALPGNSPLWPSLGKLAQHCT